MRLSGGLLATITAVAAMVGCNSTGFGNPSIGQTEQALALDGDDAVLAGDLGSSLNSLATLALRGDNPPDDTGGVVATVMERTPLFFEPADCLTMTSDGSSVTFLFDDCRTGAFGLQQLAGEMVATYTWTPPTSLGITIATQPGLTVGSSVVSLESESFVTHGVDETAIVWNGRYQATRPLRPDIDHAASYSVTYDNDSQCLQMDGSATTTFDGDAGIETFITNYERCGARGTCPIVGELTVTSLNDESSSFTLEYDGDDTAWVEKSQTEVDLDCVP